MTRTSAAFGTLLFLLAPATVAGLVPWWLTGWRLAPPLLGLPALRWTGALLIAAGLTGLAGCYARFALQGLGTPAPIAPPEKLVVTGLYRHVRNPIYVAVVALLVGQALLFGSPGLLAYAALVGLVSHLFVRLYEEPELERKFGPAYAAYRTAVPRWLPRVTPWRGG